jgi:hypothetical protein
MDTWNVLLAVSSFALLSQNGPACQAKLETVQQAGTLVLTGTCRSTLQQTARYRYSLQLRRAGPGGQSSTSQGGAFELSPGQVATLATTRVNVGPGSSVTAILRIIDASGFVVAHDSVSQQK